MLIEFWPAAWLTGIILLALVLTGMRRRGRYFLILFSIFWTYILAVVSVTIFPIPVGGIYGKHGGSELIPFMLRVHALNLMPFYFGNCWELPNLCARGVAGNVLMTIPFGFGLNFLTQIKLRKFAWLALSAGVVIETSQLFLDLALGVTYRTVDINDVIFNTLGAWMGFGLFKAFSWLVRACQARYDLRGWGFWEYLLTIV
ncbi:MAG TPA: VanZ family protein [Anaerolineales bacterium]|jgi:glycopeptide antibiotics resistance protein